jgi:membrane associated rhomboid family serine protease
LIPIPISDENPATRRPYVVFLLIALNAVVWLLQVAHGVDQSVLDYGAIPALLLHHTTDATIVIPSMEGPMQQAVHQLVPWPATLVTSMFMHGSWLHIIGNMWFLWIFGDNVEDAMGHAKYLAFYLVAGVAAAMAQVLVTPSATLPMVGASGAIAGVLGAYLILYPHARVRSLFILVIFITTIYVPAWLLLGLWFVSQFFIGGHEVAWMAHVGGFITGMALVHLLVKRRPPSRRPRFPPIYERV